MGLPAFPADLAWTRGLLSLLPPEPRLASRPGLPPNSSSLSPSYYSLCTPFCSRPLHSFIHAQKHTYLLLDLRANKFLQVCLPHPPCRKKLAPGRACSPPSGASSAPGVGQRPCPAPLCPICHPPMPPTPLQAPCPFSSSPLTSHLPHFTLSPPQPSLPPPREALSPLCPLFTFCHYLSATGTPPAQPH